MAYLEVPFSWWFFSTRSLVSLYHSLSVWFLWLTWAEKRCEENKELFYLKFPVFFANAYFFLADSLCILWTNWKCGVPDKIHQQVSYLFIVGFQSAQKRSATKEYYIASAMGKTTIEIKLNWRDEIARK